MSADDKTQVILPVAATVIPGTQLSGIYELDNRIASGGMGEVYRGHNIQTGDHVAIKVVLPEYANNQTILSLFRKEASILNRLSHEAIVRYHVFTIDQTIGRPYLAMEFVDGQSLFDVMERGPMSSADVCKLCHRLASGLSAVHEAGAVHRDLSPDNIILPGGKVERAKIIDFGIARSATIGGETLIGGSFAGKYNYVSPEQLGLFGGDVKEPSDIYSLGLVLAAAMRGGPIDMGGSQMEVVEKRRTVPDLSDIDGAFRPLVAAMLQPDPADRPASMADIARMTRDGALTYVAPNATAGRDGKTMLVEADRSPFGQGSPDFVPYIPPAHLSQPQPLAGVAPKAAVAQSSSRPRSILLAATAAAVMALAAGAYLGGFLTPQDQRAASVEAPRATPDTMASGTAASDQPAAMTVPSQPAASPQATPLAAQSATEAEQEKTAGPAPEAADAGTATAIAEPAPTVDPPPQTEPPGATAVLPADVPATADTATAVEAAPAADTPADVSPTPTAEQPTPAVDHSAPVMEQRAPVKAPQAAADEPGAELAESAAATAGQTAAEAKPADVVPVPSEPTATAEPQSEPVEQTASKPAAPTTQTEALAPVLQPHETKAEAAKPTQPAETKETTVAMNVPAPPGTASDSIDSVADRVAWLRDYRGGDCFYATVTSATDKAIEIEGFGTSVAPFEQMLEAFQAKFHVEPDVSVRLIEPAQCEITNFLRALNATAEKRPRLALDRTSVPNGSAISGTLETVSGVRGSLLLIDNKGMVFNLDQRVTVQSGKAVFSVPISLGVVDQAAGKAVPQIILAITGDVDLKAAELPEPTAATAALSGILAEIQSKGSAFSATAKYFRLGG